MYKLLTNSVAVWMVIAVSGLTGQALAEPVVPPGYLVEAYVTGLRNSNAIAFCPGGDFGYDGQLFVGDSRPNPGTIYRVPSKGNKIFFAFTASNEPRSLEFAPLGSPFGSFLYCSDAYTIQKYDSTGARTWFANIHAFGWDLAFASDDRFRNNLFHADGWEPAREAVREWNPGGTHSVLVYTDREETVGLAFGPGNDFGNDLYVLFQKQGRHGYKPATISRVTPEGLLTDWFVFPATYENTIAFAFDSTSNFRSNLFISEFTTNKLLEIDTEGNLSEFGSGFSFSSHPDHWHLASRIAFGPDGAMYVSDGGAGVVWRIAPILGELDYIEITGPNEVAENSTAQYKAIAYYTGGTVVDVTNWVVWSIEPNTYVSIDYSGMLSTQQIHDLQENAIVSTQYTSGNTTVTDQKLISIFSICPSGYALKFDGQDDYAKLPTSVIIPNAEAKSIGLWFTVNSWRRWNRLFMWWDGTNKTVVCLGEHEGQLGGKLNNNSEDGFHTNSLFSVGEWHYVCYTFDGSTTKVYFDGQEISDLSWDDWYVNDQGVYIGARPGISSQYFDGEIDEVQVWNKALTEQEVQLYMHKRPSGNDPNLVGYWDFNEGEGQVAHDLSDSNNHGQLGFDPDIDNSDPCWIDSDAPVGFCTLEGLVKRDLSGVFDAKLNILEQLGEAMAQENIVLDMLNTHFKNRDFGTANKNDVVKAKQRIHSAKQHDVQAETDVYKSINSLTEALLALDCEVDPHNHPELLQSNPIITADINGDRVIDYRDFAVLASYWLESYQLQ